MLRMRTAIVLAAGFAAGYVAGTGRGPDLMEKVKNRADAFLSTNGFTDAGERLASAAGEVAQATGARVQNVSEDVASRVEDVADRISPDQTDHARA